MNHMFKRVIIPGVVGLLVYSGVSLGLFFVNNQLWVDAVLFGPGFLLGNKMCGFFDSGLIGQCGPLLYTAFFILPIPVIGFALGSLGGIARYYWRKK